MSLLLGGRSRSSAHPVDLQRHASPLMKAVTGAEVRGQHLGRGGKQRVLAGERARSPGPRVSGRASRAAQPRAGGQQAPATRRRHHGTPDHRRLLVINPLNIISASDRC